MYTKKAVTSKNVKRFDSKFELKIKKHKLIFALSKRKLLKNLNMYGIINLTSCKGKGLFCGIPTLNLGARSYALHVQVNIDIKHFSFLSMTKLS